MERSSATPSVTGSVTDVPGVRLGHAQRTGDGWLTGATVVLPPPGSVGAVDVRGGGPATHETDALSPASLVPTVDAILLTGGSAFGLAATAGVQQWCEESGRGFQTPGGLVPIVPGAAIYDLARGGAARDSRGHPTRPDAATGYSAAANAAAGPHSAQQDRGQIGAGTGARVLGATRPGGVGSASVRLADPSHREAAPGTAANHPPSGDAVSEGATVAALAVVNAHGTPLGVQVSDLGEPVTPSGVLAGFPADPGAPTPAPPRPSVPIPGTNTTLAVVATDLALSVAQLQAVCSAAHAGMARALDPVHSLVDGDVIFGLATGSRALPQDPMEATAALLHAQQGAATCVQRAILDAVRREHS